MLYKLQSYHFNVKKKLIMKRKCVLKWSEHTHVPLNYAQCFSRNGKNPGDEKYDSGEK